jgi:hypothetical protein
LKSWNRKTFQKEQGPKARGSFEITEAYNVPDETKPKTTGLI